MRAAPGRSLAPARQLEPHRADPKPYSTHLIVTDRGLVIVYLPFDMTDVKAIERLPEVESAR
jgi:hypothetical protein